MGFHVLSSLAVSLLRDDATVPKTEQAPSHACNFNIRCMTKYV